MVPKESSHFGFWNGTALVPLRESAELYGEDDRLGLRQLDEGGRLELVHAPGMRHMHFSLAWFTDSVVRPYLAVVAGGGGGGGGAS